MCISFHRLPFNGLAFLFAAALLPTGKIWGQSEKKLLSDKQLMQQLLRQSRFDIDTTAQAVVLYEKGYSVMNGNKISYKLERIVKILGTEAISDFGTIDIAKGKDVQTTDIDATTYNLEGTEVIEQSIHRSDIFKDKIQKGVTISKFNLPSLKRGSIIYYTYTTRKEGYSIPDWDFQNEYPTLYSEYQINIPDYVIYSAMQKVNVPCITVKKKKELETCTSCTFSENYGKGQPISSSWVRRNVPAFKEEPFMSSNANYLEQVKIRVTAVIDNGVTINFYKNWDEYSKKYYYKDNKLCGQAFDNNNFLKEKVAELTNGKVTDLDKAKAIFTYVRGNFHLKETNADATSDIKDVFLSGKGSLFGINLLLTAMMRKAGLNSAPVILTTRSEEQLNQFYPDPQNINYLVCKIEVDKRDYFLDASAGYIPFGTLPAFCYNGYCRVITEQGGFAILNPDSVTNRTVVIASLNPEGDKFRLITDYQFGVISSMHYRKNWQEDSNKVKAELAQQLKAAYTSVTPPTYRFVNPDRPDEPLKLRSEATLDLTHKSDMVYFNPYFDKFFGQNPLPANNRTYPVEMNYLSDMNYILNFTLPDNFIVDDYPKSAVIKLGDGNLITMKNIMDYNETDKKFTIISRFISKSTVFNPENYTELRTFFDHVIEEQNKKIVLRKTL